MEINFANLDDGHVNIFNAIYIKFCSEMKEKIFRGILLSIIES